MEEQRNKNDGQKINSKTADINPACQLRQMQINFPIRREIGKTGFKNDLTVCYQQQIQFRFKDTYLCQPIGWK